MQTRGRGATIATARIALAAPSGGRIAVGDLVPEGTGGPLDPDDDPDEPGGRPTGYDPRGALVAVYRGGTARLGRILPD